MIFSIKFCPLYVEIQSYFKKQKDFKEVYLLRNDNHFKIYNFNDGKGFEPDFLLLLKNINDEYLNYQIFIEPKGEHLVQFDKWKEEFLENLQDKHKEPILIDGTKKQKIIGLPFYNGNNASQWVDELDKKIK